MEVHHHAHTARKKWTHYFWEFLMLFLAVFCGFLAENFREHRVEEHRAKEFARSLIKDLSQDTAKLSEYKKRVVQYIWISDTLLALSREKLEGPMAARFSFYTRFAYWTGGVTWSRTTFDQIKSSGSMRYFDHDLVEKLLHYDELINDIQMEYRNHDTRGNMLVNSINKIIDPHLHQDASRLFLWSLDTISVATINAFCNRPLASLENKRPEIQELLNMVVVQQRNLRARQNLRDEASVLAKELIKDFSKAYHLD